MQINEDLRRIKYDATRNPLSSSAVIHSRYATYLECPEVQGVQCSDTQQRCHSPLLIFPSTNPLHLPALIKIINSSVSTDSSITQRPLNRLFHTHSLPDRRHIMCYSPALCSYESAHYLSACCLPWLPLWRHLPHSELRLCSWLSSFWTLEHCK